MQYINKTIAKEVSKSVSLVTQPMQSSSLDEKGAGASIGMQNSAGGHDNYWE